MTTPSPTPSPTSTPNAAPIHQPTPDQAFMAYCHYDGDLDAACRHLAVPLGILAHILTTPAIVDKIAAWFTLRTISFRLGALRQHAVAAAALERVIDASNDAVEVRRAATTLASIARAVGAATKPTRLLAPEPPAPDQTTDQPTGQAADASAKPAPASYAPACDDPSLLSSASSSSPDAPSNAPRSTPKNSPSASTNSSLPATSINAKSKPASSAA